MLIRIKGMLPGHRRAAALAVCMLLLPAVSQAESMKFENDFSVTHNNITGPGAGKSSLTQGFRYADELRGSYFKVDGDKETSFQFTLKATNDRAIDS